MERDNDYITDTAQSASVATVIDLFCGAGGLAYGLRNAGCKVTAGVDLDPACRYPLETNTGGKFICKDISEVTPEEIDQLFDGASVRVLAGCAPCQPFSTYSQSRRSEDARWKLLAQFQRLAISVLPEIITMENVTGLAGQLVWTEFVEALQSADYSVSWREVACEEFGVPQSRRRLVLLASRLGPISLPKPTQTHVQTVKSAIGDLPPIQAGKASSKDPMHIAATLSPKNRERIRASKPGGTWRDWPDELRADCHKKKTGQSYPSVYGRMSWDELAPTMTTQCYGYGNGRFGHPEQDRAISLREAAIIQSFPRDYAFIAPGEKVTFSRLGTLIGNAVPPKLGEAIGKAIISHLMNFESARTDIREAESVA